MLLPLFLILVATLSSAIAVYGTLPQWALYSHGMQVIQWTRQLQWPLLTLSLILCLSLMVLIIIGKHRIWWLIGLAPVMALFCQQFISGSMNSFKVIEQPETAPAQNADFVPDEEYVVGLSFNEQYYAFPLRQLFNSPVILQSDREKKMCLMWSAFANRAMAFHVQRSMHARDLDIVSMPANAILIYNARVGQFINGLTGLTPKGDLPNGFRAPIPTLKTHWRVWRAAHPNTRVMHLPTLSTAVGTPILPQFPMRSATTQPAQLPVNTPVVVFATTRPAIAIQESRITPTPINIMLGELPVVIFRDKATGRVKAFERRYADRQSKLLLNPSPARAAKGVYLIDVATNSGWTTAGVAVDGDPAIIGAKLAPVTGFEEGLYYGVMREWYPTLELLEP